MSIDFKISTPGAVDRASHWFMAAVYALTTAMSAQTIWWMRHPTYEFERDLGSTWDLLRFIATFAEELVKMRGLQVDREVLVVLATVGGVLVALATIGVLLRRSSGFALVLPCSTALISLVLLGRYFVIFEEPRQYVAKSPYVQTATELALLTVAGHGAAVLLGLRLLRGSPGPSAAPLRLALGGLALVVAVVPVWWWLREGIPGGGPNALIACACIAAVLAAAALAAWPRGAMPLAALATTAAALLVQAVGLVLLLGQRPRRQHLHSMAAEQGLLELSVAVPSLLAILGLGLVLRRRNRDAAPAQPAAPATA